MELADHIASLIPTNDEDMWRGRARVLLEIQHRQFVDLGQDGRVYRRDLEAGEATARLFAALMSRRIGKGAYRRKEKRLARRHPVAPINFTVPPAESLSWPAPGTR